MILFITEQFFLILNHYTILPKPSKDHPVVLVDRSDSRVIRVDPITYTNLKA